MEKDNIEHNQINKPVETYGLFYWRVFDGYKSGDFLFGIWIDLNLKETKVLYLIAVNLSF